MTRRSVSSRLETDSEMFWLPTMEREARPVRALPTAWSKRLTAQRLVEHHVHVRKPLVEGKSAVHIGEADDQM
ncbi:MAG TPA: hypothetical protein VJ777_02275 [Mycobacterium sp.]|nr:hypothetical protein [Mycobacterium sp.]